MMTTTHKVQNPYKEQLCPNTVRPFNEYGCMVYAAEHTHFVEMETRKRNSIMRPQPVGDRQRKEETKREI